MKKLLFMAVLLVPGLAYGQNPSAELSVSVVPTSNGIACGVGPAYVGSVPTPAQTAGFTTCAANYDFTSSSNFTFGGKTFNFSTVSTWMSCGTTSASNSQPLWFQNNRSLGRSGEVACNEIAIVADPLNSSTVPQVLSLSVGPGDTAGLSIGTATQSCADNSGTNVGGCWGLYPTTNMYVETVFRLDTTSIDNYATNGSNVGFDSWSLGAFTFQKEVDFIENFGSNYVYWMNGNNRGGGSRPLLNAALTSNLVYDSNYHTMGLLVSGSAAANLITACPYFDGHAADTECQTAPASSFAQQLGYLILWNFYNDAAGTIVRPTHPVPVYIKAVRVWSCAGWNNTNPPTFNTSSTNNCSTASPPTTSP
jgi:hypothetical protein